MLAYFNIQPAHYKTEKIFILTLQESKDILKKINIVLLVFILILRSRATERENSIFFLCIMR